MIQYVVYVVNPALVTSRWRHTAHLDEILILDRALTALLEGLKMTGNRLQCRFSDGTLIIKVHSLVAHLFKIRHSLTMPLTLAISLLVGLISSTTAETILGVTVFTRNGDRKPAYHVYGVD